LEFYDRMAQREISKKGTATPPKNSKALDEIVIFRRTSSQFFSRRRKSAKERI
jgi:hypothetical protein